MNVAQGHESACIESGIKTWRRLRSKENPLPQRYEQRSLAVYERIAVGAQLTVGGRVRYDGGRLRCDITATVSRAGKQVDAHIPRDPQVTSAVGVGRVERHQRLRVLRVRVRVENLRT